MGFQDLFKKMQQVGKDVDGNVNEDFDTAGGEEQEKKSSPYNQLMDLVGKLVEETGSVKEIAQLLQKVGTNLVTPRVYDPDTEEEQYRLHAEGGPGPSRLHKDELNY